jgi:putative flavoprotein involved in K+ transport
MTAGEEDLAGASGASDELVDVVVITPTQYDALPGMPFPGPPDTYPAKEQVADYLNAYAAEFNLPVRLNTRVTALIRTAEGFEARTDDGVFRARQVVVATGPFQVPYVPGAGHHDHRRRGGTEARLCCAVQPGLPRPAEGGG